MYDRIISDTLKNISESLESIDESLKILAGGTKDEPVDDKFCKDCGNYERYDICESCRSHNRFVESEKSNNEGSSEVNGRDISCNNCVCLEIDGWDEPCLSCNEFSKFTPKKEEK